MIINCPYINLEVVLREAKEGSKAIDTKVWALLVADPQCQDPKKVGVTPPPYSTDIDTALALVDQLFTVGDKSPTFALRRDPTPSFSLEVYRDGEWWMNIGEFVGETLPLAILNGAIYVAYHLRRPTLCQEA